MTPPEIEHADWCTRPALRPSEDFLDRTHIRWRCPECSRVAYTTKTRKETNQ